MNEKTAYYRAAGKSLAAIHEYLERRIATHELRKAFAAKHGAKEWAISVRMESGEDLAGLNFDGEPPAGWKKFKSGHTTHDFCVPCGKGCGKVADEMRNLRLYGPGKDGGRSYLYGNYIHWPGFEKIGDDWYISQHEKAEPPPDSITVKRSEFWAIKEANALVPVLT